MKISVRIAMKYVLTRAVMCSGVAQCVLWQQNPAACQLKSNRNFQILKYQRGGGALSPSIPL